MSAHVTALTYCLECSGPLIIRTSGGTRFEKRAVLDCMDCGREHLLVARLCPSEDPVKQAKCGSTGGYASHLRKNEDPCDACKDARRRYIQGQRAAAKGRTA